MCQRAESPRKSTVAPMNGRSPPPVSLGRAAEFVCSTGSPASYCWFSTLACGASREPPLAISRASRKPLSCHSRCYPLQPGPATPPQLVLFVSDLFLVFG